MTARTESSSLQAQDPEVLLAQSTRLDWIEALILLADRRQWIMRFTLAGLVLSFLAAFLLPPLYTGKAKIMPPQQSPSLSTLMMGQLGPLAGLSASKDLGLKNPSDLYASMLQSKSVSRGLIDRFKLLEVYGKKNREDAEKKLQDRTTITVGKDGVITVAVEDRDPQRAADLANAYVDELRDLNQSLSSTEAEQRRAFYEKELADAKAQLSLAEQGMKSTQEKTGLLELGSQSRVILESVARLRAQVSAKEVQVRAMQSFASPQNSQLQLAQQELAALKAQLAKLEGDQGEQQGSTQVPTAKVPESGLEYIRSLRTVKYQELVFELLAKQYEAAKLDEARMAVSIQFMDRAVRPERRSWPIRSLLVALGTTIFFLIAVFSVFLEARWRDIKEEEAPRLDLLRRRLARTS